MPDPVPSWPKPPHQHPTVPREAPDRRPRAPGGPALTRTGAGGPSQTPGQEPTRPHRYRAVDGTSVLGTPVVAHWRTSVVGTSVARTGVAGYRRADVRRPRAI